MNEQSDVTKGRQGVSRRRFIGLALAGSVLATLAGVLTPILGYLWPPARAAGSVGERVLAGTTDEFPPNSGKVVSVNNKPVIVVNTETSGVKAFSAVCTHLGCIVYWHKKRGIIQCPCHDGRFSPVNGRVISGPPPAPLPEYSVQVVDNEIYVGAPTSA